MVITSEGAGGRSRAGEGAASCGRAVAAARAGVARAMGVVGGAEAVCVARVGAESIGWLWRGRVW